MSLQEPKINSTLTGESTFFGILGVGNEKLVDNFQKHVTTFIELIKVKNSIGAQNELLRALEISAEAAGKNSEGPVNGSVACVLKQGEQHAVFMSSVVNGRRIYGGTMKDSGLTLRFIDDEGYITIADPYKTPLNRFIQVPTNAVVAVIGPSDMNGTLHQHAGESYRKGQRKPEAKKFSPEWMEAPRGVLVNKVFDALKQELQTALVWDSSLDDISPDFKVVPIMPDRRLNYSRREKFGRGVKRVVIKPISFFHRASTAIQNGLLTDENSNRLDRGISKILAPFLLVTALLGGAAVSIGAIRMEGNPAIIEQLTPIITPSPVELAPTEIPVEILVTNADNVIVRGVDGERLFSLDEGTQVLSTGIVTDTKLIERLNSKAIKLDNKSSWYKVIIQGTSGFVYGKYLTTTGNNSLQR